MNDSAKPIFVLGTQRSGTTWLANILCSHPDIAGVQHKSVKGIMESCFFSHIDGRYGSLNHISNQVEFVEVICKSDYFRLAGCKPQQLYALMPSDYATVFRMVMEQFAQKQNAKFWIEKTPFHTPLIHKLNTYYPDAKFIAIRRNIEKVVHSAVGMAYNRNNGVLSERKKQQVVRATVKNYTYYNYILDTYSKRHKNIHLIHYENLKANKKNVIGEIVNFLDLSFYSQLMTDKFPANTSSSKEKTNEIKPMKIKRLHQFYSIAPSLLNLKQVIKHKFFNSKQGIRMINKLPEKYFKLHMNGLVVTPES